MPQPLVRFDDPDHRWHRASRLRVRYDGFRYLWTVRRGGGLAVGTGEPVERHRRDGWGCRDAASRIY